MDWKEGFPRENIYYETERGILYCGDVIDVLSKFPSDIVNIVFTSPPYNVGIEYEDWNDNLSYENYKKWCYEWSKLLYKVLAPDGRLCLNHYLSCGTSKRRFAPIMDLNCMLEDIGFHHYGVAIWWDVTLSKRTAWGSWLSSSAPYLNSPFEAVLVMYKDRWKRLRKGKTDISKEMFMEISSGVWRIQPERNRKLHPAPFPEKLVEYVLRFFSFEDDIVLDPFIGSGTTAVVADKLNRYWVGIELSEKYCEVTANRLEQYRSLL